MSRLKPLPDVINGFRVIEDLGDLLNPGVLRPRRYANAECKLCFKVFKARVDSLKDSKSCGCIKLKSIPKVINGYRIIKDLGTIKNTEGKWRRWCLVECKACLSHFTSEPNALKPQNRVGCGCLYPQPIPILKENPYLKGLLKSMIHRCENPKDRSYKYYGGKGIKVCDEWTQDNIAFYDWALMNGYKLGLSIDRIDNSKNYCPSNCRFVTPHEQLQNQTTTKLNPDKVRAIRKEIACYSPRQLGLKYGVNASVIRRVVSKKRWSNIQDE